MNSIVTPKALLDYSFSKTKFPGFKCPELCIICFTGDFFGNARKVFEPCKSGPLGLSIFEEENRTFGLFKALLGTPSASISLEMLIGLGFKRFIALGSAGSLKRSVNDLQIGEIVVGQSAFIDEGLSSHYMQSRATRIKNESELLKKWLLFSPDTKRVSAWTTEAPFMETGEKFKKFSTLGASIVEMEMSPLLAVAKYRNVQMLNLFVVSDILCQDSWKPGFSSNKFLKGKKSLFEKVKIFIN